MIILLASMNDPIDDPPDQYIECQTCHTSMEFTEADQLAEAYTSFTSDLTAQQVRLSTDLDNQVYYRISDAPPFKFVEGKRPRPEEEPF